MHEEVLFFCDAIKDFFRHLFLAWPDCFVREVELHGPRNDAGFINSWREVFELCCWACRKVFKVLF